MPDFLWSEIHSICLEDISTAWGHFQVKPATSFMLNVFV